MHDRFGSALCDGHLQRFDDQRCAQVRGHRPTDDPPAEHVEDDGQVEKARQGRHVGDVGRPQAVRLVGLEAALDPIRRRPGTYRPARRAGAATPAHAGDARGAHHPRDPLAADRHAVVGQVGVNPRRAVRAPAASVNLPHTGGQLGIGLGASRRGASTPRVVPARGDTEHAGHRGDAEPSLIRTHEPVVFPGPISRANQAVAFAKISRSSRSRRTSRRSRRISSRSSVFSPSLRAPASRSACATHFRMASADGSNSRASSPGLRPDRTSSTICCRNAAGYGGLDFGIVDSSSPTG